MRVTSMYRRRLGRVVQPSNCQKCSCGSLPLIGQPFSRMRLLGCFHSNKVYGSMVTYLRIKSIVPGSSEPRPQQQQSPPQQH